MTIAWLYLVQGIALHTQNVRKKTIFAETHKLKGLFKVIKKKLKHTGRLQNTTINTTNSGTTSRFFWRGPVHICFFN